jgi:hypothetical protein
LTAAIGPLFAKQNSPNELGTQTIYGNTRDRKRKRIPVATQRPGAYPGNALKKPARSNGCG